MISCVEAALRQRVRRAEQDAGLCPAFTSNERAQLAALERENCELRSANEHLRKASAYFAQGRTAGPELNRRGM